jgi:hypothetical protein
MTPDEISPDSESTGSITAKATARKFTAYRPTSVIIWNCMRVSSAPAPVGLRGVGMK